VVERCMRQQISRGIKEGVLEEAVKMYTRLKNENGDPNLYDLFASEYKAREV